MVFRKFYSEVGKLLYSISCIDGTVNRKEYEKLRDIVKKKLVPQEDNTDQFGTDAAYYAEIEFDILLDRMPNPISCFNSFCDYIAAHHTAFDKHHKEMMIEMARDIAQVYRGTNSKEAELIKKLKKRLNEIFPENQSAERNHKA